MKFKIKGWPQFDGRKYYSIKKIVKDKKYAGGYKVYLNETKQIASLEILIDKTGNTSKFF